MMSGQVFFLNWPISLAANSEGAIEFQNKKRTRPHFDHIIKKPSAQY